MTTLEQLEKDLDQTAKKVNDINRKLDARKHEYQLTQSMIENLEGFPESIKFLNKNKSWGIEPPLISDLIYSQEEYRVAIENYLDPYLNYYVVPTIADANKAIDLLSNAQKGKANFFILDYFTDQLPPTVFLPPGTTQAIDLVNCDPPYKNLATWLLQKVLIVEQDEIPDLFDDPDVCILSKSGRFIRKRHTLGGGSIKAFPANVGGGTHDCGDWADYVDLETALAANNLDAGSMRYIMNSVVKGALKQTLRASAAGSDYIMTDAGEVNGYPVVVSNQMQTNDVLFGNYSDCVAGMWSGLDVVIDPYTQSASGQVILTVHQDFDVAVRRPQSFALGS